MPADGDEDVAAVMRSCRICFGVNDADDILEKQLRKHFIELTDEATEGAKPNARERYEMTVDTRDYSADYPLQWGDFQERVDPGHRRVERRAGHDVDRR